MWRVRLLLGAALIGLLLAGVWQGEIHAHDNAVAAHVHEQDHDHDHEKPKADPPAEGSAPGTLHIHDAAIAVVMLGSAMHRIELARQPGTWLPDGPVVHARPSTPSKPHRPPIA